MLIRDPHLYRGIQLSIDHDSGTTSPTINARSNYTRRLIQENRYHLHNFAVDRTGSFAEESIINEEVVSVEFLEYWNGGL